MNIGDVERGLIGYWLSVRDEKKSVYWHFEENYVCNWIIENPKFKVAIPGKWRCSTNGSDIYLSLYQIQIERLRTTEGYQGSNVARVFDFFEKSWFPGEKYITGFGNGLLKKMLGMQDDIASAVKVISIDQWVVTFDKSSLSKLTGDIFLSENMFRVPSIRPILKQR